MFKLLAVLAFTSSAVAQFTIGTPPSVTQCQPVMIKWSGGSPPYWLATIPAGQPSAPSTSIVDKYEAEEYSWTVKTEAGSAINLKITDGKGNIQYSSQIIVQAGSDDCAKEKPAESSASEAASSSASEASSAGTSAATSATSATSAGSGSSSSSTTSVTASKNATAAATPKASSTLPAGHAGMVKPAIAAVVFVAGAAAIF